MFAWYHRRWIDLVTAIYIYNEHLGYTALDRRTTRPLLPRSSCTGPTSASIT